MFPLCGKKFKLLRTGLMRAACPVELANLQGNLLPVTQIVVVRNAGKFGTIAATNYTPEGVIVAGALTRSRLMANNIAKAWLYAEENAISQTSDMQQFGCKEFMASLDAAVIRACGVRIDAPVNGQAIPRIKSVQPFRSFCTYEHNGKEYQHGYSIDAGRNVVMYNGRRVLLAGAFINADQGIAPGLHTGMAKESMQRVQTGVRYASAPPRAGLQSFTTGGATSELVTQIIRNTTNITSAVMAYLQDGKAGIHANPARPSFYPVNLTDDHKIQTAFMQADGIDGYDFAVWALGWDGKASSTRARVTKQAHTVGLAAAV